MERTLELMQVACDVERMANRNLSEPIAITFEKMHAGSLAEFTQWQRQKFILIGGDEYFFICRAGELLYVVNVSGDSILTAAKELITKIADKF